MITEPELSYRSELHTIGIRTHVTMEKLASVAPQLYPELIGWLDKEGIIPGRPGFFRYLVIDRDGQMEVEVGIPVTRALTGDSRIQAGILPAGIYGTLTHIGSYSGLAKATAVLLDWGEKKGIHWQISGDGKTWGARIEYYLNVETENNTPDSQTEIAILVADN
jgi:effector-binding domain-containing protein